MKKKTIACLTTIVVIASSIIFSGCVGVKQDESEDVAISSVRETAVESLEESNQTSMNGTEKAHNSIAKVNFSGIFGTDSDAVEPLITALGDGDNDDVRRNATWGMRGIFTAKTVIILGEGDSDVRESAAIALGKIGEPAVEPLMEVLEDGDSDDMRWAAITLGRIGDTRAVEPLIKVLGDRDWGWGAVGIRESAVDALGKIGDERAVAPLMKALGDRDWDIRRASISSGENSDGGDENEVEILGSPMDDVHWAATALGEIGEPAVEPLIKALGADDGYVRESAAMALGEIGDERAVEPLTKALEDSNWDVRKSAAIALGKIGEPAVEPLVEVLGDGDSDDVSWVVIALGEIGDERAVEPLIEALGDSNRNVRKYAAGALGVIGDERAVDPLIKALLEDRDDDVRVYAARALGRIGDERAVEPLIKTLGEDDYYGAVRVCAAWSLGEIGDDRAEKPLIDAIVGDSSIDVQESAIVALGKMCKDDPEKLLPYLENKDTVRVYSALIMIGKESTEDALIRALDGSGYTTMAEDYLNCGNSQLRKAAMDWVDEQEYEIDYDSNYYFGGVTIFGWSEL